MNALVHTLLCSADVLLSKAVALSSRNDLILCCYIAASESMPLSDVVVVHDHGVLMPNCTQMRQLPTYAEPQSGSHQSYD